MTNLALTSLFFLSFVARPQGYACSMIQSTTTVTTSIDTRSIPIQLLFNHVNIIGCPGVASA